MDPEIEIDQLCITASFPLVVTYQGISYYIGADIAKILNREVFNVYRSLRVRGINVIRVNKNDMPSDRFKNKCQGSVTLINKEQLDSCLEHLRSKMRCKQQKTLTNTRCRNIFVEEKKTTVRTSSRSKNSLTFHNSRIRKRVYVDKPRVQTVQEILAVNILLNLKTKC